MTSPSNPGKNENINPLKFIQEYSEKHPDLAKFGMLAIFIGCVFAALSSLGVDVQSNTPVLVYYAVIVFIYIVITRVIQIDSLMNVSAYSLVFGLLIWIVCAVLSNSFFSITKAEHLNDNFRTGMACLKEILNPCQDTIDKLAEKVSRETKAKLPPAGDAVVMGPVLPPSSGGTVGTDSPPSSEVKPKPFGMEVGGPIVGSSPSTVLPVTYRNLVFMQFAGAFVRDDIRNLMQDLTKYGWNMQGVSKGGQRTSKAAGLKVVRYAPDVDKKIAEQLVEHLAGFALVPKGMTTERNNLVKSGTLEIWISN